MLTAKGEDGHRISVINGDGSKNTKAFCPCCGKPMVAKAGEIRRPHWAHVKAERCDEWWEQESDWHIDWRKRFLDADKTSVKVDIEHVLDKNGEKHFSDVRIDDRLSLILRRARLDPKAVNERISFFGDLIWMVQGNVSEYHKLERQIDNRELSEVEGLPNCYICERAVDGFCGRWIYSQSIVVFDFRLASSNEDEKLWIVIPGKGWTRNVVCLSIEQFLDRLLKRGRLFEKSVEDVNSVFASRKAALKKGKNVLGGDLLHATVTGDKMPGSDTIKITHQYKDAVSYINTAEVYGGNSALADYWSKRHGY